MGQQDPGIVSTHEHFGLEVVGDSMIGKAIVSGDRGVVRRGCGVRNGDTVVAQFDDSNTFPKEGEAALRRSSGVGGHVWLLPENPPTTRSLVTGPPSISSARCAERTSGESCASGRSAAVPITQICESTGLAANARSGGTRARDSVEHSPSVIGVFIEPCRDGATQSNRKIVT